jgi:hypothetical protein
VRAAHKSRSFYSESLFSDNLGSQPCPLPDEQDDPEKVPQELDKFLGQDEEERPFHLIYGISFGHSS